MFGIFYMRNKFKRVFNKKILTLILTILVTASSIFGEEIQVKLSGDYLSGCSFLKKDIIGISNFRTEEFDFTENSLYVTNFKNKTYSSYDYSISGDYLLLKKKNGSDYFPQSKIRYSLTTDTLLSKYQLVFFFDDGTELTLIEEESLRKNASDVGSVTGKVSLGLGGTATTLNIAYKQYIKNYLEKHGFPKSSDYKNMNLDQEFLPYIGESNGSRLSSNLQKAGISKPQNAAAHHIVPKKDKVGNAEVARQILDEVGIDLDNPINGVYLPTDREFANTTNMAYHSVEEYMHQSGFISGLTERLSRARRDYNLINEVLSEARDLLLKGDTW